MSLLTLHTEPTERGYSRRDSGLYVPGRNARGFMRPMPGGFVRPFGGSGAAAPPATTYAEDVLASDGLLGYWKLDEASGIVAADSVGSNDGAVNGCTVNQDGQVGKCYSFDGVGDNVVLPAGVNGFFRNVSRGVLECLFYSTVEPDATHRVISYWSDSGGQVRAGVYYAQAFSSPYYTAITGKRVDSDGSQTFYASSMPARSAWHHMAGVLDWANSNIYLYIDGALVASSTEFGTDGATSNNAGTVANIGSRFSDRYFTGLMQHFAAYVPSDLTDWIDGTIPLARAQKAGIV